jgi:hypothetical protein
LVCVLPVLVSFLWGAVAFGEAIGNYALTTLALLLLIVGIIGLCLCNSNIDVLLPPSLQLLYILPFLKRPKSHADLYSDAEQQQKHGYDEMDAETNPDMAATVNDTGSSQFTRSNWIIGLSCAVLIGVMNGSSMVPMHYKPTV